MYDRDGERAFSSNIAFYSNEREREGREPERGTDRDRKTDI